MLAAVGSYAQTVAAGDATVSRTEDAAYAKGCNEFSLDAGFLTLPGFATGFGVVLGIALTGGAAEIESLDTHFALGCEYYHWLRPKFAVGASATAQTITIHHKPGSDSAEASNSTYLSLMPAIKWRYIDNPRFGLYSKLAAGVMASPQEDSINWAPAFQLGLIGMEMGGESLRGFLELGAGMQGLINAGIKYSF